MWGRLGAAIVLALAWPAPAAADDAFDTAARADGAVLAEHLQRAAARITNAGAYPTYEGPDRLWRLGTAADWRSGFFPASHWLRYAATLAPAWKARAEKWLPGVAAQASRTTTHDLGFMVFLPFHEQWRLTATSSARSTILKAAGSLATRFNPAVGATRSWNTTNGRFRVIVDNLMNLELLFWAARNGGQAAWRRMAHEHALTSLREHVRPDGSTFHVVDFDPATGAVIEKLTVQGLGRDTTWSRGQAWAVHGLTTAFRETRDPLLLAGARRTAAWYLDHLPASRVPLWDFHAPAGDPTDTSAAAIAAAGLLELARLDPDAAQAARWRAGGERIALSLSAAPWLDTARASEAAVLHGTSHKPAGSSGHGIVFGDFYLGQALDRRRLLPSVAPLVPIAKASNAAVVDGNPATAWTGANGSSILLDLGAVRRVGAITLSFAGGDVRTARFRVSRGTTTSSMPEVLRRASSGASAGAETFDLVDADARFLRVTAIGSTGTSSVSISEARVRAP